MKINEFTSSLVELDMPFTAKSKSKRMGKHEVNQIVKRMLNHIHMMQGKTGIEDVTFGDLKAFLKNTKYYSLLDRPEISAAAGVLDRTAGTVQKATPADQPSIPGLKNNPERAKLKSTPMPSQKGNKPKKKRVGESIDSNVVLSDKQLKKIAVELAHLSFKNGASSQEKSPSTGMPADSATIARAAEILKKNGITGVTLTPAGA